MTSTQRFARIDLSRLPVPPVLEPLDFEAIRGEILADLAAAAPELADVLDLESEPLVKLIEIFAYRELGVRGRINDAAKATMLAFATGGDLEHLAAIFGVQRLVVDMGDPDAVPPVVAIVETDDDLRARTQLAFEGQSTAGPEGAYIFHALSADGAVKDVSVTSPTPGEVVVAVLSSVDDGTAPQELLESVAAKLDAVRPLTDQLTVQAAAIQTYAVEAVLTLYPGPDAQLVKDTAQAAVADYVARNHRVGHDVTVSGLLAALHCAGVQNVALIAPVADIVVDDLSAAFCSAVTVSIGGRDV